MKLATAKEKRMAVRPPAIPPEVAYYTKSRPTYPGYQRPKPHYTSAKDLFIEQRANAANEWREERN